MFKLSKKSLAKRSQVFSQMMESLEGRALRSITLPVDIGALTTQLVGTASTQPSVAESGARGVVTSTQQGVGILDGTEVYAQRVDSLGNSVGAPIHVNTTTLGDQAKSSVAMAPDGSFVVGWISGTQAMMREFNADGTPASAETAVSNILTPVSSVAVAKGTTGKSEILYSASNLTSGSDVYSALYNADGTVASTPALLNVNVLGTQNMPTIAALPGGQFVTAFASNIGDGNGFNIVMQRLSSAGAAVGSNTIVNDITGGDQLSPDLVYNAGKNEIAMVYQTTANDGGDIAMQLFNTDGTVKSPSEIVNTVTTGVQSMPLIGATDAGTMAVTYVTTATGVNPIGTLTMLDSNGLNMGSSALFSMLSAGTTNIPVAGGATNSLLTTAATTAGSASSPTVSMNPLTIGNLQIVGTSNNDTVVILPGIIGLDITVNGITTNPQLDNVNQITVNTGDGNDSIMVADLLNLGHINCLLNGGNGNDTISAGNTDDTLLGGLGNDVLKGGGGADLIDAGDGNDSLMGEAGNDTLVSGEGSDTLSGGDGIDLVSFADHTAGVRIDLTGGPDSGENGEFDVIATDVENALGSAFNDTLIGNSSANLLDGGAGDDTLDGGLGSDTLIGNAGNDTVSYATRTTNLTISLDGLNASGALGENDDIDTSVENAIGGAGNDLIVGNRAGNNLLGGAGNDTINGMLGNDTIIGGDGNDVLLGDYGFDFIAGGDGNDTIDGGHASDMIFGDAGDDSIMGGPGNDTISGGDGVDRIKGGSGNDSIDGDGGDDRLYGDTGADRLFGDDGNDIVYGGTGNDYLEGGTGTNKLYGESGSDTLNGGDGIDRLDGGLSHDVGYYDPADKYISVETILGK